MKTDPMEWHCGGCGGEGDIDFPESATEHSLRVICRHCQTVGAYLWCGECGMGGQIARDGFAEEPREWICRRCGTGYPLPPDFYREGMEFRPEAFSNRAVRRTDEAISSPFWRAFVRGWRRVRVPFILGLWILLIGSGLAWWANERSLRVPREWIGAVSLAAFGLAGIQVLMDLSSAGIRRYYQYRAGVHGAENRNRAS